MSRDLLSQGVSSLVAQKASEEGGGILVAAAKTTASIAASNPLAAGILVGVAGIAAAAALISHEVALYKKAEHEAEIQRIISIWEESGLKALGLHPPFEFIGENREKIKTNCFEKKRGRDTALRDPLPLELINYRVKIDEAMRGLRNYIENASHGSGTGMSTLVSHYLLNLLESEALRFEGRDQEITLTTALSNFVCSYAHDEDSKHTQRISFLSHVFLSLDEACDGLKRHQKSKPFVEIIQETLGTLRDSGDQLIRFLVKVVTPNRDWNIIDHQKLELLKAGIVAPNAHERLFLFIPHPRNREDKIPSTFMDSWFHLLIQYYETSRDPDSSTIQTPPMSAFTVPSVEEFTENARKWRTIFEGSDNFITRELDPNEPDPAKKTLVPVRDIAKIRQRVCFIADICALLHITSTLQAHFTGLHHFANSFGINAAQANEYENYYTALWKVCRKLINQIEHIKNEYQKIKAGSRQMPIVSHLQFQREFLKLMEEMGEKIKQSKLGIEQSRKRFNGAQHPTASGTEHILTTRIQETLTAYNMVMDPFDPVAFAVVHPSAAPDDDHAAHPILDRSEINGTPIDDDALSVSPSEPIDHVRVSRPLPQEPVLTTDVIHEIYRGKCKHTSLVQTGIFGLRNNTTPEKAIADLRERAKKNPNGASASTIHELETTGRIARVANAN